MRQGMLFHAALLVVAAGLAFFVWTGDKPSGDEKPTLLELELESVAAVSYTWPDGSTAVAPVGQGDERSYHVELKRRIKKLAPKPASAPASQASSQPGSQAGPDDAVVVDAEGASSAPAESPEPEYEEQIDRFPAGDAVVRALKQLAPLQALRSLGKVEGERLEKMGLKAPERMLEIQAGGESHVLEVGEPTYGAQGRYAKLKGGAEVFLLPSTLTTGFEGTDRRLMEQRLLPLDIQDIVSVEVRAGVKKANFVHVDRDQAAKRHFALTTTPDVRSEEATGLVTRLRGLRATAYLEKAPPPGASIEAAAFVVGKAEGRPVQLTLLEKSDGTGYLVRAEPWVAAVADAQARALVEDLTAALPTE